MKHCNIFASTNNIKQKRMKKQALFLMAGALVAFASCNTATNDGASEAQIDSTVNARVEEIRLEMMAQNDSLINAMAQMKADSIIAAMKGGSKAPVKKSTTTTKVTDRPVDKPIDKPATIGNGKPKIGNQNQDGTIGNGKPKVGDKQQEGTIGNGKPKVGR
jgi:hypothetical protein